MSGVLDHAGIAARIPHQGAMCLLDAALGWDAQAIRARAVSHADPLNPLRGRHGLPAAAAIEYAAQAAALHGGLLAEADGATAAPGYLASARAITFHRLRLDDLPGPLEIEAVRQAGDARQLLYGFAVRHAGEVVVEGRLAVVLDALAGTTPAPETRQP